MEKEYYSTSYPMRFDEFIRIEVKERKNYTYSCVARWMKKYNLDNYSTVQWVSPKKYVAARYLMIADDWNRAEEVYNNNPDEFEIEIIDGNSGIIINESDDGDDGFLFLFN